MASIHRLHNRISLRRAKRAWLLAIFACTALAMLVPGVAPATPRATPPFEPVFLRVPDAPRLATLYADGSQLLVPIESIWRPMCSSTPGAMTQADLLRVAAADLREEPERAHDALHQAAAATSVQTRDDGGLAGGFNLVFDADGSVPAPAVAALDRVRAFYATQFTDNITVTVNMAFDGSLPAGVLGATNTPYTHASWNISRNGLKQGMDGNDIIQNFLPNGTTIPVRYNGNSPFATAENRVFWTVANFNATVGFVAGDAGTMRFNSDINWDYDPDNGVNGYSFIDVVVHEVGHVLGFDSGVDFRDHDMEALDIYRFQRTDGSGDYNPDTYAEFQVRPRLISFNLPNNDVISDIIIAQYKMEDGHPYQGSHFYDKTPPIGIMDPVLGQGQTFNPNFFTTADQRMFDAIGWDR